MSGKIRWRLGVVSDAHRAPVGAEPYIWQNTVDLPHSAELLEAGLRWLALQELDQLVLLGDLTEAADKNLFLDVREQALGMGVPVLAAPGNCDVDPLERTVAAFERIAGEGLTVAPALLPREAGSVIELIGLAGEPGSKQLAGVRATGAPTGARIILTHYPVLDLEPDLLAAGFRHSGNLTNRAGIEADLRALDGPVVVIHGHLHIHDAHISGNLLHLSCGALIEPPHLVSVIDIAFVGDRITVSRQAHSVRSDVVERLPVFVPLHEGWCWDGGHWSPVAPSGDIEG